MSLAHEFFVESGLMPDDPSPAPAAPAISGDRRLHRIAEVRRRQGISVRSAARRMHTSMEQVRRQEEPHSDLPLSELYHWQSALEVPIAELLVEMESPLSEPILTRARLLRVMKTVRAIKEAETTASVMRLATMMEQQLLELMPELKDVAAWHSVGRRRGPDDLGRAAERVLPESFFIDAHD